MTHTKVCKLAKVKIGVLCGNYLDCGKSSYNSWRPEAVSDEWEMRQVSLDSSFQDLLWPCVAERGAVLVQQVHQFFSDHPVIQNFPVSYKWHKTLWSSEARPHYIILTSNYYRNVEFSKKIDFDNFWFFLDNLSFVWICCQAKKRDHTTKWWTFLTLL